ncbi:MAG TPA: HAD family hydrolase [Chitinispirillaceae bacterium]|nr:HAD family hydrolase [Chitinispirillaceae bacterium]
MSVKALIFDIDGTILTPEGVMSERTLEALRECHQKGIVLSVATARAGRLVFPDGTIPGEHSFLLERGIFYNGGTILDKTMAYYQHTPVPGNIVREIVATVTEFSSSIQIALQHDDLYHSFRMLPSPDDLAGWGFSGHEIEDFSRASVQPATKIMVFNGSDFTRMSSDMTDLYNHLVQKFSHQVHINLADSCFCLYIISKHAGKGVAGRKLVALHGIKPEETAVFGDDTPDLDMFTQFTTCIAMGNAHEDLKKRASFVTRSNYEEGIEFALREYLKVI